MLFLAGLIGMVAVSTAAMWGFEELSTENARDEVTTPGDTEQPEMTTNSSALLDIATGPEDAADDPEGDDYGVSRGTTVADTLSGTSINEFLDGLDDDDTILAGDGDDVANGGDGNDAVSGDRGDDTLHGGAGNDTVSGGDGNDSVLGHDGDDLLDGEDGDDSLLGGEGDDTLSGGAGNDALHGYLDDDTLDGGAGSDTLFGGDGNDQLSGIAPGGTPPEDDQDYLNGGAGDDRISLGAGDIATGGNGADSFILRDWLDAQHQGQIVDFNTSEDNLVLLYDDTGDAAPDVSIEGGTDVPGLHRILLDGEVVAEVTSDAALTLAHITLIPQTEG
ncbi:Hemolysin, chromosomal [Roseovarius sp. THAF9]|uniref:calcium-binding protein n=1 Tax=Roseovarius sp. THAF9 TaxID=2587847 RepID=UPI00126920D8|nr:calcium-binding protein [Roseovarius sp. THAF9]QFT94781.1 Hemolysin, chromosomal [Roseovarius sp. THAF9]